MHPPSDPWQVDLLDLDDYLARIGVPARTPSVTALDELVAAHVQAFSFENLEVLLDQHAGVELAAVATKFVGRGRGGYCFEHATLFAAVLTRLGYDVARHLGRVGDPQREGRTHLVLVVSLDGLDRLVDVGIGRPPFASIPLVEGTVVEAGGWRHRVERGPSQEASWWLQREHAGEWEFMHATDLLAVRPVDVAMGHHWTSTHPDSHFRTGLSFGRFEGSRHTGLTLDGNTLAMTTREPGEPTAREEIGLEDGLVLLDRLSGGLSAPEIARLREVLSALGAAV